MPIPKTSREAVHAILAKLTREAFDEAFDQALAAEGISRPLLDLLQGLSHENAELEKRVIALEQSVRDFRDLLVRGNGAKFKPLPPTSEDVPF